MNIIEEGLKKINPNIKFIIQCPDSPDNKCKEDLNGNCYYCGRKMVKHRNPKEQKEDIKLNRLIDLDYEKIAEGIYEVQGNDPTPYRVDIINNSCTCKSWYFGNEFTENNLKTCKHLKQMNEVNEIERKGKLSKNN